MRLLTFSAVRSALIATGMFGLGMLGFVAQASSDLELSAGPMYEAWSKEDSVLACCLKVQAPADAATRRRPIQVVLALDVSRQTAGTPLKAIKEAAMLVANGLHDGDRLAVVAFSDFGRTVFSMQQLNASSRKVAAKAITTLREEAGRNVGAGLDKAQAELMRHKNTNLAGRYLLLLTIGDATKGSQSPHKLLSRASTLHDKHDIAISTLGFSTYDVLGTKVNLNEDLLRDMALNHDGRYYFVEELENASSFMGLELELISEASARQVRIEINTQSDATITNVAGARQSGKVLLVGDMRPGQCRRVVFDLANRPERERDVILNAVYIEPGGFTERRLRSYVRIPLTSGSRRLDREFGPFLAVFDLQEDLAHTAEHIKDNRREYLTMYRSRVTRLEQENNNLGSAYIADQLKYYQTFERRLDDTAVWAEILIMHTKFRLLRLLYGIEKL
ncbi:MAG: VWA domain-containing protein [Chitinivibrionales bacterium]|nr:VWA domain-containing protein [Chitinivibrionales bacterium]MBD3356052.1 VWA domain-containing protein [Chitinivibrionales bacterium]